MKCSKESKQIIREMYPVFCAIVAKRLEKGAEEYGDASFEATSERLLDEIEQELADVNGWSFIQWCRIRNLRARLGALEKKVDAGATTTTDAV